MTFEVKTGYGYFSDNKGNVIDKAELPLGNHILKPGYTYTEVASYQELASISVYVKPKTEDELIEDTIKKEQYSVLRQLAIDSLKDKGILDADGKLKGK